MLAELAADGDPDAAALLPERGEPARIDRRFRWLWDAWLALAPSRPMIAVGMAGVMSLPLPWAAVEEYADRLGCDVAERLTLHEVLNALDSTHRTHEREQIRQAAKQ
jgi:hypothetical protein